MSSCELPAGITSRKERWSHICDWATSRRTALNNLHWRDVATYFGVSRASAYRYIAYVKNHGART